MKKIKLSDSLEKVIPNEEYTLDPTEKYVINLEEEIEFQSAIMMSFQVMGPPPARDHPKLCVNLRYGVE